MSTLLAYGITTDPFPLQASEKGSPPEDAELTVVATNHSGKDVTLKGILIRIPIGEGADQLTNDSTGITPHSPSNWKNPDVSPSSGLIEYFFAPQQGNETLKNRDSLSFMFGHIRVNSQIGEVGIEAMEYSDDCASDDDCPVETLTVTKFPHGWGEVSFDVDPDVIPSGGSTVLRWRGPVGATYTIEYYIPPSKKVKVPAHGQAPLSNDGTYKTLALRQTTTFTLRVEHTIHDEPHKAVDQKTVTVELPLPMIKQFSGFVRRGTRGPQLVLNWETDADSCTITGDPWKVSPTSLDDSYVVDLSDEIPLRTRYVLTAINTSGKSTSTLIVAWKNVKSFAVKSPVAVCVSPDGKRVYLVNERDSGGQNGEVFALDASTLAPKGLPVKVGYIPAGIAVSPDGARLYVTSEFGGDSITVLNSASDQVAVLPSVSTGRSPRYIAVRQDGRRVYVANIHDGTLSMFQPAADTSKPLLPEGRPIRVGGSRLYSITALAISPDGLRVFVGAEGSVIVVDAETLRTVGSAGVGKDSVAIAVSSDGKRLAVALRDHNTVLFFSVAGDDNVTLRRVGGLTVPISFRLLTMSMDSACVYAVCQDVNGNAAWITIDWDSQEIIGDILNFGRQPAGIVLSGDGTKMFVVTQGDGNLWALTPSLARQSG